MPCGQQRVLFTERAAIYADKAFSARELILPSDGVIVLGDGLSFDLNKVDKSEKCAQPNGDAAYTGYLQAENFFDPNSWITMTSFGNIFVGASGLGNPVPHSERVPCRGDQVVYPNNSIFKTTMNLIESLSLSKLQLGDATFTSNAFQEFLSSDYGQLLFTTDITSDNQLLIDESLSTCSNDRGCACGNERADKLSLICGFVADRCPQVNCHHPIKPTGFCCAICGASLVMSGGSNFKFDMISNLLRTYKLGDEYSGVETYIHATLTGQVQVVFVHNRNGTQTSAKKLAAALAEYLREDGRVSDYSQ